MKHFSDKTDNPFFAFLKPIERQLVEYENLIKAWQKAVNLIAPMTLNQIWERHIYDSAQLWPLVKEESGLLVDMGSGAGFPGIVLALCNTYLNGRFEEIVLIESDTRKSVFLSETIRILELKKTHVINDRIEKVKLPTASVITARALADIPLLLKLSGHFRSHDTRCLFLKGAGVGHELLQIGTDTDIIRRSSQTDLSGVVIELREKQKE